MSSRQGTFKNRACPSMQFAESWQNISSWQLCAVGEQQSKQTYRLLQVTDLSGRFTPDLTYFLGSECKSNFWPTMLTQVITPADRHGQLQSCRHRPINAP